LSPSRQAVLDEHGPQWLLALTGDTLVFTRPTVLEIGIGGGEALLAMAAADPDTDVIGVDVHTPGIAAVVQAIVAERRGNMHLVDGDVLEFAGRLPAGGLAGISIFFPDPWPKQSQRWRRLVTAEHVDRLVPTLAPGGYVHLATDIADYAEQMVAVCGAHPELHGGPIERPATRPVTRYERKGLDAGRTIVDLWYIRGARGGRS